MKEVLFFRHFRRFSGGHLKVWHYFNHVRHSPDHTLKIRFSGDSIWDESNPWYGVRQYVIEPGAPISADVLFLAGLDWLNLTKEQRASSAVPIINLVQNVRHARPQDPRYAFLGHRAIRICCGSSVYEAIRETGRANGPLFMIPCGLDFDCFPAPLAFAERDIDVLIVAVKRPRLGPLLNILLWRPHRRVYLLRKPIPRSDFLKLLCRARVSVFLPHHVEGEYLPPLEGMALHTVTVCPHGIGPSYCVSGQNCLRPAYTIPGLAAAAEAALRLPPERTRSLTEHARRTVAGRDLATERRAFLDILENVDQLW